VSIETIGASQSHDVSLETIGRPQSHGILRNYLGDHRVMASLDLIKRTMETLCLNKCLPTCSKIIDN
jgi:uncharacterized protein YdaL